MSIRRNALALGLALTALLGATGSALPASAAPERNVQPVPVGGLADTDRVAADAFVSAARRAVGRTTALSVTVWRGDRLIGWHRSGVAMSGRAITASSRFRIASMSKLITAATVLRLAELGKIQLDRPLLGQWKAPRAPRDPRLATVTVRQFLMHISGLGEEWSSFFVTRTGTWRNAAEEMLAKTLETTPGTRYEYSNGNYVILGRLIEAVTGLSYQAAAQRFVLTPLGIRTATMVGTAQRPWNDPRYAVGVTRRYMERLGPAGAWVMTPTDVRRLANLRTSTGAALLSAATTAARRVPGPVTEYNYRYGMGLMLFNRGGWGHTGTIEGARGVVVTFPNGVTAIVIASVRYAPPTRVIVDRLAAALDRLEALPR